MLQGRGTCNRRRNRAGKSTLIKVLGRIFPPDSGKLYLTGIPYQMESIAAAIIGDTALRGGRGRIACITLSVIPVVMLGNIFNLFDINFYWQQALRGSIFLLVVGFSQYSIMKREKLKQKIVKQ